MFKKNIILITTALLLILLLVVPSKINKMTDNYILSASQPLFKCLIKVGRGVSDFFSVFTEISSLHKENHLLADQLVKSKVDSSVMEEYKMENINLKKALEYKIAHPQMKLMSFYTANCMVS